MQFALERGLIVRVLPNDVVSICPPLIVAASEGIQAPGQFPRKFASFAAPEVSSAEVDEIFDRLEGALSDALAVM